MRNTKSLTNKLCFAFKLFTILIMVTVLFFGCNDNPEDNPEIRERLLLLSSEAITLEEKLDQVERKWEEITRPPEMEQEILALESEIESLKKQLEDCLKRKSNQSD